MHIWKRRIKCYFGALWERSNEPPATPRERVKLEKEDFPSISEELLNQINEMEENELMKMMNDERVLKERKKDTE